MARFRLKQDKEIEALKETVCTLQATIDMYEEESAENHFWLFLLTSPYIPEDLKVPLETKVRSHLEHVRTCRKGSCAAPAKAIL